MTLPASLDFAAWLDAALSYAGTLRICKRAAVGVGLETSTLSTLTAPTEPRPRKEFTMATANKTLVDLETKFWHSMVDEDTDAALAMLTEPRVRPRKPADGQGISP